MNLLNFIRKAFAGRRVSVQMKSGDARPKSDPEAAQSACMALPWHGNDIYLEDRDKQVKAVCSNPETAKLLAECMECYSSLKAFEGSKTRIYGKFIQDAYYLYVALSAAKIPVNSIETAFVEKAFHEFCKSLTEIVSREHLTFEDVSGTNGVNMEKLANDKELEG